jgi:hypothetical protein
VNTWYLGIHMPNWLARPELAEVPVFISRRTFYDRRAGRYRRTFPRAAGRYAIDSGGFTELKDHGRWTITPAEYVDFLDRVWEETGAYDFAAIIDSLLDSGVRNLHGFGFKIEGLRRCWAQLATADSLSWSKDGRHAGPCQHPPYSRGSQPISEANCLPYALAWRHRHVRPPTRHYERQLDLFADCEEAA